MGKILVTASTYGKPPVWQRNKTPAAQTQESEYAKALREEREQLGDYAGELLEFREWCIANSLPFRMTVVRAIKAYRRGFDK